MKKARLLSSIGEHRATFYLDYLVSEVFSTSASIQILLRHLTGSFFGDLVSFFWWKGCLDSLFPHSLFEFSLRCGLLLC